MSAPQGTDAWRAERAGHVTASVAGDVLAKIATGEAAGRRKLRAKLLTERLTGIPIDGYQNAAMLWGTNTEPEAREAYEAETGDLVTQVGFIKHPTVEWVGASPDGCIDDDGLLELKCPESTTHLEWLQGGNVPTQHVPQLAFQLWVTGRKYVQFCSYDPRFPEKLRLFIVRYERDEKYITGLAEAVAKFLAELDKQHQALLALA